MLPVALLNDIIASERRMAALYRRLASMTTGPYRNALTKEFLDHAKNEDHHAQRAMDHLVANDGECTTDIKEIPKSGTLEQSLSMLEALEEKGITLWTKLLHALDEDDAFRHTVEDILSREQEHLDDVKLWRRQQTEKSMNDKPGDIGSPVPLNLHARKSMPDYKPAESRFSDQVLRDSRAETPPTRWGAFNGMPAATTPGIPSSLLPALVIKAVSNPAEAGGQSSAGNARKRDPQTGKFAETASVGPSTTAKEDMAIAERAAHLAQARRGKSQDDEDENIEVLKALDPASMGNAVGQTTQPPQMFKPKPNPMQQAGIPGGPPGQSPNNTPATATMNPSGDPAMGPPPLGTLQDGTPVFDDPYNPAHQNFTPDQHEEAAQLHNQHAEMATQSGRIPTAMNHQMKARVHSDLAQEAQSPMERVLAQQGMPGQAVGDPNAAPGGEQGLGNDPMDSFLNDMTEKQPGQQNNFDQGKPPIPSQEQVAGPLPRMINTHTGTPVGPQSQSAGHAGTVEKPEAMPPEPPPGNGSMPDISGPETPMPVEKDPMDWDPADLAIDGADEGGSGAAPPSHAGAKSDELQPEAREEPTPGSTESEPAQFGAGPSTSDAPADQGSEDEEYGAEAFADENEGNEDEGSQDGAPFSGNPTEDKADEEKANKSFNTWFDNI